MRDLFFDSYFYAHFFWPTLLLCVASTYDFLQGRFPNFLFVLFFIAGSAWCFLTQSPIDAGYKIVLAFISLLAFSPLYFFRVLGAGDVKIISVLVLFTSFTDASSIFAYSLFWGLLIGIFKLSLGGDLNLFVQNFYLKSGTTKSSKVPYAVALLLGWLTFSQAGGLL